MQEKTIHKAVFFHFYSESILINDIFVPYFYPMYKTINISLTIKLKLYQYFFYIEWV